MNANDNTIRTCKTKYRAQDITKIATVVTFDWTGCTQSDYRELAEPSAVIMAQTEWRKGTIPESVTINVHELVNRERAKRGPVDPVALFQKMSPDEQVAFLAAIKAKK